MSHTHKLTAITIAALLLATAAATASPSATVRAFYLYGDEGPMTEGAPTNADPLGISTLRMEFHDGAPFAARTPILSAPLEILRDGAFRLHLDDRSSTTPYLDQEFQTQVRISVQRDDGLEVLAQNGPWYLANTTRTFVTSGGSVEAEGWSDFHLAATQTPPVNNSCNAAGECIVLDGERVHIPAGFRLTLEFGLTTGAAAACGPLGIACAFGTATSSLADFWVDSGDFLAAEGPIDPDQPLPMFPLFNGTYVVERAIRQLDGRALAQIGQGAGAPAASWHTASVSSDSRLEIRVG